MTRKESSKTTARIVGALILIATVTYMLGNGLLESILNAPDFLQAVYPNRTQVVTGVLLEFIDAAVVAAIGVLLFPLLRKYNETIALGYAGTRLIECLLLLVAGIGSLSLITLSQNYALGETLDVPYGQVLGTLVVVQSRLSFQIAMLTLGLGSMPFCYLLYQSKLIPRSLSILGFIGYLALFIGGLLELFNVNLSMIHYLPGGVFELILPIWLIAKGFNPLPIATDSTKTDITERHGEFSAT